MAQDNTSSSVAQRHPKVRHPWKGLVGFLSERAGSHAVKEGSRQKAPSDSGDDGISDHRVAVEVGSGGRIPVSFDWKPPGCVVGRERLRGRGASEVGLAPWP